MTTTSGSFSCTKCKTIFNEEYEPSIRPRRSCPKCHKTCDLTPKKRDKSDKPKSNNKPISPQEGIETISPRKILYEIFIDKNQPATARVAAIREYNNIIETKPEEESDDGFLKWLETHGNNTLINPSTIDTSLKTSTFHTKGKNGNTNIKTRNSV